MKCNNNNHRQVGDVVIEEEGGRRVAVAVIFVWQKLREQRPVSAPLVAEQEAMHSGKQSTSSLIKVTVKHLRILMQSFNISG